MGEHYTETAKCNCDHILITRAVQDECFRYYVEKENLTEGTIAEICLLRGPKATLLCDGYVVSVDSGFICID